MKINSKGLSNSEVVKSREEYGTNALVMVKKDSFFKQLIRSLGDPIIKILLIALGIKTVFLIQDFDWYETVGIVIAIFLASFISTISEYGSEKAFIKLQREAEAIKVKVRRDGKVLLIDINEVVVGDIILLDSGDRIVADGVLIKGEVSVDESSITGESKEVYKKPFISGLNPSDNNELLRGSVIYHGVGEMMVTKVGVNTFYGKISLELQEKQPESPLKLRLRDLAKVISRIGYVGAFLVAFSYLFSVLVINNNFDINRIVVTLSDTSLLFAYFLEALTLAVTIIVVSVPEGLPMMITLVLSSNMKRMLKDNVLVRKLMGIETAGSLNILFTDKTGTLTKGELEVVGVMFGNLDYYKEKKRLKSSITYYNILKKCILSNTNCVYDDEKKMWIGGNSTDKAVVNYLGEENYSVKKIKEVPFDSKNKYSYTKVIEENREITYYKGAPEVLLDRCKYYILPSGRSVPFVNKKRINDVIDEYAKKGIRVLMLGLDEGKGLSFISLLFIKDELREKVREGIELVRKAGIKTVMITGDNKVTAMSIARDAGIINSDRDVVLTSSELNRMSDDKVKEILPRLSVVARALPTDKSRLVRLSQELGLVVGMTGDGVNDAPALKKCDVGFSMGSGTEVAKEASDIVLLDNNFNSIVKAILYGRTIFKSIRKFIIFQLTVNFCAVFLSIVGPFIGVANPVTVIQMLWVNMVMDTLAGIAFSYEAPLLEYMEEPPKKRDEKILNSYMIHEIVFTSIYSFLLCIFFLKSPFIHSFFRNGKNDIYFMSAFFGLFIFMMIFNSFNARTSRLNIFANLLSNKVFLGVIIFIVIVQVILIYYGGDLFRTTSLSLKEIEIMLVCAFSVIPVEFLRKLYLKSKGKLGCV
ncbi:MAG TPA: calcium-translocating P-type ATPase, PMCA-type [Candidatus Onthousia excrementipullorum]|uniref:P-type Ca(2+) transporter n=1 Tax=Candidatus Onthousia excrementipullorum TaxID=2840884 RepID=A0A9D1DV74_9FIRM|nr:calcium-translocating P-type ATPase, PMCA-type [Candidatus Onthousia excrementipullorum]